MSLTRAASLLVLNNVLRRSLTNRVCRFAHRVFPNISYADINLNIKLCEPYNSQKRYYAKGKSKGGKDKQKGLHLTEEELSEVIDVKSFKEKLEGTLQYMTEDFANNLSIRTNLGSLESLEVELEGKTYPLSEIAQVIKKNPSLLIVNASTAFPQAITNIKKAIVECGMNLNPQQDGTTLIIQIPKVTKEHREKLAQNAKNICNKTKISLRDIQSKYIKETRSQSGTLSADLVHNSELKIQSIAHEYIAKAEELMKNKQNELLKSTK